MSSISTAALEYNTDGELTIKNRQNESTGNSLKFKTSNSVTGNDKLIEIKQNNNSRLSIDEIGTGAIKIERNSNNPSDLKNSTIKIESNTASKTGSDVNKELKIISSDILLSSSIYSEDGSKSVHSNYINIYSEKGKDGYIELQNEKYRFDNTNNKYELDSNDGFISDSHTYMNLGVSDLQLGSYKEKVNDNIPSKESYIKTSPDEIELKANNGSMKFDQYNGIIIDSLGREFVIKNINYSIRASNDDPAESLRFDCVPDTNNPNNIQNLMEMTKESVNIPKLTLGDNKDTKITGVAITGSTPSNVDQTLTTFGCVKNLIPVIPALPNIKDPSKFYLQTNKDNSHIFYIAYRYGPDIDKKVYGLKVTFDGNNTSSVAGFVGQLTDEGSITESTASG